MSTEFEQDLAKVQASLGSARQELLSVLGRLNDRDLERGPDLGRCAA